MKTHTARRWLAFLLVFVISMSICLLTGASIVHSKQQLEQTQMERLVLTKTNKLNEVLSKLLYKTQILSVLVQENNGEIDNFEQLALAIVDDPAIKNLLIAPDGIVSQVYPLAGNEAVIGLNYLAEGAGNAEAVLAMESGELILGGPFDLVQGGQALVGRLPVYIPDENNEPTFWGLVSVTLNYPQALAGAELSELENMGFGYELWRISPDTHQRQIIASSTYEYSQNARYVEKPITIFNTQWYFRIAPIREWYQYPEAWLSIFAGLLISILLPCLLLNNYDLNRMKQTLENLSTMDPLTGLLNRRGLFLLLEESLDKESTPFILSYVDLDRFKEINDGYGHSIGDKVLLQFAHILQKYTSGNELIARIGGDEFVIVFQNTTDKTVAEQFFAQVAAYLQESPTNIHDNDAPISIGFSTGLACYPDDGHSIERLISIADDAMYASKKAARAIHHSK